MFVSDTTVTVIIFRLVLHDLVLRLCCYIRVITCLIVRIDCDYYMTMLVQISYITTAAVNTGFT